MPIIIPPTRVERTLRMVAYAFVGVVGLWEALLVLLPGAPQLMGPLGQALELAWSALMVSALIAAGATVVGLYRVEMTALPLFTSALVLAAGWDWARLFIVGSPLILGRAAIVTALCLELAARYWTLHRLTRRGATWTSSS